MSAAIETAVIRIISRAAMVPMDRVTPETSLASLGIGSLEQIECVLAVEEELKVEIDTPSLSQTRTVQDVIDAVGRALPAAGGPPPA